jgi:hypothetical protein
MNDERSFERTTRAWLERGANQAPDRAIQAVLLAIETTPQERDLRIPWRFPVMNTPFRIAAAAIIGLLIVAVGATYLGGGSSGGIGGGPAATQLATPTPSWAPAAPLPSPSVPALTQTFTSSLHGYSVKYPAGWTVTQATAAWPLGKALGPGQAFVDFLLDATALQNATARIGGTSQPLAPGQSAETWMRVYNDGDQSTWPKVAVGDQTGFIVFDGPMPAGGTLVPGGHVFEVAVVVEGRGYDFTLDGNVDRDYLAAMLATVVFDPASAVDPTAAP